MKLHCGPWNTFRPEHAARLMTCWTPWKHMKNCLRLKRWQMDAEQGQKERQRVWQQEMKMAHKGYQQ